MIIDINFNEVVEQAEIKAKIMVENGLYSRFGLSYNSRIEKAKLGCIGEIAFEEYLRQKGHQYSLDQTDFSETNSDEFDFLIGGKKIDIKVAKKSTARPPSDGWTYGYPQEQNPISKDFIIVGWVDFTNREVGLYGWITGERVSRFSVVTKNSFAGYNYLTPNHEFRWGVLNKNINSLIDQLV